MSDNSKTTLSPRQAAMLQALTDANGRVVTFDALSAASGIRAAHYTESRNLAMHVSRLRAAVRSKGIHILSVRGEGYVMRNLSQASN